MKVRKSNQPFRRLFAKRKHRGALTLPTPGPRRTPEGGKQDLPSEEMSAERRWHVLTAYGKVLEACSSSFELESQLPFPKHLIREAIRAELTENPDSDLRSHLEIAYAQLEAFLPAEDFRIMQEFRAAGSLARRMSLRGDPGGIIASARILKFARGEKAVGIQEKISLRMRARLRQIQAIGVVLLPPVFTPVMLNHD